MSDAKLPTKEEAKDFLDRESEDLIHILTEKDDLVPVVLRFHLLTEYLLERIVLTKLPKGHRVIENAGLSYHQKLELVHSFDVIPDSAIGSLRRLNRLRNTCSHTRDAEISRSDIEAIGSPLGKPFIELRGKYGANLKGLVFHTFGALYSVLIKAVYFSERAGAPSTPVKSE